MEFLLHHERTIRKMIKDGAKTHPSLFNILHLGDHQQELVAIPAISSGDSGEAFTPPASNLFTVFLCPCLGQIEVVLQVVLFDGLLVGGNCQALADEGPISPHVLAWPIGETGFIPEVVQQTPQGKTLAVGLNAGLLGICFGCRGWRLTASPGERKVETQLDLILFVCKARAIEVASTGELFRHFPRGTPGGVLAASVGHSLEPETPIDLGDIHRDAGRSHTQAIRPEFGVVCALEHLLEVRLVRRNGSLSKAVSGHCNLLLSCFAAGVLIWLDGRVLDRQLVAQLNSELLCGTCGKFEHHSSLKPDRADAPRLNSRIDRYDPPVLVEVKDIDRYAHPACVNARTGPQQHSCSGHQ